MPFRRTELCKHVSISRLPMPRPDWRSSLMMALPVVRQERSPCTPLKVAYFGSHVIAVSISFWLNLMATITLESTHAFDARFVHRFPLRFPHCPRAALVAHMIRPFAIAITLGLATPALAQYGGPPM